MRKLLSITGALAFICSGPSLAEAPSAPAELQPYIHNGHFDPGDYGWLRGYFPGASAADQAAFEAINNWRNACTAASREQMRTKLQAMGIANPSLDNPPSDPICTDVTFPRPTQFTSFADLQRAAAEARPYADTYLFALRLAEQQSQTGGTLAEQLEGHVIADQMVRIGWAKRPWGSRPLSPTADAILDMRLGSAMSEVDRVNTEWLKAVVARHGWPSISQVGPSGAANAWLLVQHADADPAFQLEALRLMEPLLAKDEVDKSNYALLYDRLMVNTAGKQRYGTQMTCSAGKLVPRPIEDEAGLTKRRADMGLPPMADYLKLMSSLRSGCPPA